MTAPTVPCVGQHDEPEEAENGYLCHRCFSRMRSSLLELPEIAAWLEENIAAGGPAGEKVTGSREDPIPLRVDITDLIGPDSRSFPKGATTPRFLLWDGTTLIADYGSWREAERAWREVMHAHGVPVHVVAMLARPFTRDEWVALADADKMAMDAAHGRWQIRPTEVGGSDQHGEEAFRAELFHWVRVVTEENPEFTWPDRCDLIVPLVQWLTGHLSWIVQQPWVDEFIDGIRQLAVRAHRVAPWRAEVIRDKRNPCGSCDVMAVVIKMAEGKTVCEPRLGGCGRTIVWDHDRKAG